MKTCLFKYIEIFTTKKENFETKNFSLLSSESDCESVGISNGVLSTVQSCLSFCLAHVISCSQLATAFCISDATEVYGDE